MDSKYPVDILRDGTIGLSIFRNTRSDTGDAFYSVSLSRAYQDKDGEWQHASTFGRDDLLKVQQLANEAYRQIGSLERSDKIMARQRAENVLDGEPTNPLENERDLSLEEEHEEVMSVAIDEPEHEEPGHDIDQSPSR